MSLSCGVPVGYWNTDTMYWRAFHACRVVRSNQIIQNSNVQQTTNIIKYTNTPVTSDNTANQQLVEIEKVSTAMVSFQQMLASLAMAYYFSVTTAEPIPVSIDESTGTLTSSTIEKYERIQRHVLQRTMESVFLTGNTPRYTQTGRSSIDRVCSPDADGAVFSDDDFHMELFRNDALPVCSCYEEDNTAVVLLALKNDASANVTEYLSKLNQAFTRIVGVVEYNCSNTCERCFASSINSQQESDSFCGILQTNESSTYRGTEGNFTLDEYRTGEITAASWERLFSDSSFSISTCIQYTKNEVGTLCFGSHFSNLSTTPSCYVTVNDTQCQSCSFPNSPVTEENVTNNDCFIVDCRNIVTDAHNNSTMMIDTCDDRTVYPQNGILRFVEYLERGISNTSVTVGRCDGFVPTVAPSRAPIWDAPEPVPGQQQAAPTTTTTTSRGSRRIPSIISFIMSGVTIFVWNECL